MPIVRWRSTGYRMLIIMELADSLADFSPVRYTGVLC